MGNHAADDRPATYREVADGLEIHVGTVHRHLKRIRDDRPDINAVLTSMALDEVFDVVSRASVPVGGERELPRSDADRDALSRTLLKAHRALMELSEHNAETFRDVVAKLEQTPPGT